jgi:hypothetical protein
MLNPESVVLNLFQHLREEEAWKIFLDVSSKG